MQIVIPMAGEGTRYLKAGYKDLKSLIKVEGKPIIEHVVDLFPGEKDILFICSKKHLKTIKIHKLLKRIRSEALIASIHSHKLGPVETVLRAKKYIKDKESVIINYCDFSMIWNYENFKNLLIKEKIDGAIICYKGFHPHLLRKNLYAGVKANKKNIFQETREKFSFTQNPMDSWQSAGTYYFKNGEIAKWYLEKVKREKMLTNGEYYIPWAYNLMKKDKLKTVVFPAEYFCQWGTPEDLEEYLYWSKYFNKNAS